MKHSLKTRISAVLLAVLMLVGLIPMSVSATEKSTFVSETHDVFKRTQSTIAPGVTQDIVFAYAKDGKQMAYYVATADVNRDDVAVYANYKDNQCAEFGMQKLTEQMAAAEKRNTTDETAPNYNPYYTVVAGVNADFYNMTTGQPSGAFVMEGTVTNHSNNRPFFGIQENGTPVIGYGTANWDTYNTESKIVEAVGGSQVLVWNGKDVTATATGSYNTDRHSRTCVGITADGKVVMMVLDGRQEPFSCGGTMHELAQIMLEAGCVSAINLDGGGSTTFAARQEGENDVTVVNRPSDGSERSISSSLMIVSTVAPSNVFDRAVLTAENTFVTPNSTVNVTATGVSPAGTAAEIPANAAWQLADSSFGTIENGVFTSNGKTGDVVVQMTVDGVVVGETTIKVVIPDSISFAQSEMVVPFGKTVAIELIANYGYNTVAIKSSDVKLTLSNTEIGSINGLNFTAGEEGIAVTEGTIAADLVFDSSVSCNASILLGKGSEIISDFEDNSTSNWYGMDHPSFNYIYPEKELSIVTEETGKVHSGDYAMSFEMDFSNNYESGYQLTEIASNETIVLENALSVGMWMYIPKETVAMRIRMCLYDSNNKRFTAELQPIGKISTLDTPGWYYVSADLSKYSYAKILADKPFVEFYVCDRSDTENYGYDFTQYSSLNTKMNFYIDDITIDYSTAVDDREAPIFNSVVYADQTMSDAVELKGQTSTYNVFSFTANVTEDTKKNNYTGLDVSTTKAYIDGNSVPCEYNNGKISLEDIQLADGKHTVKFEICDKQGNLAKVSRDINVNANSDLSTIKVVPHDATLDKILLGSLYYVDVVATDIEKVKSVSADLDLNNMSIWQLDHMEVTDGFTANYTVDEPTNTATITITREEATDATGEAALVSIPVRTWEWGYTTHVYGANAGKTVTYAQIKNGKEFWPVDVNVIVDRGLVVFTDDTTDYFSGDDVQVDTEMYAMCRDMIATAEGLAYYNSWNCAHEHRPEHGGTPTALDDKAATCTESGYTGRTYCEECNSVVDWGTTIPATGHTYEIIDGVLKCACGELYSGEYEGKLYIDGALASGWNGNSYYTDGVKVTGIQLIDGYYYDLGEDGVSADKIKYTGVFYDETVEAYRYAKIGVLSSGWTMIGDDWYYFDTKTQTAKAGHYKVGQVYYDFEETGRLVSGVWANTLYGTRYYYGPAYHIKGWQVIDGNRYFFEDSYRYEGYRCVHESNDQNLYWFDFGDDGICRDIADGFYEDADGLHYVVDGLGQRGLMLIDGDYYFFNHAGNAVAGKVFAYSTQCNLPCDTYYFGDDYKMVNGIVETENGVYYYENGKSGTAGLTKVGDDYYFVGSDGKCATGSKYAWATNCDLKCDTYEFGADGKMLNGIVEKADGFYYYVNGKIGQGGLTKVNDDYYFVASNGKCVTGSKYAWATNCDLKCDTYEFGADGKMLNGIVEKADGVYYYVNGKIGPSGLTKVDDDYYFVCSSGKCATGSKYAWATNCDLKCDTYEFGADGKMYNGLVEKADGIYYYKNGKISGDNAGLTKIGDYYYFICSNGKCVTGSKYAWATNCDLKCDTYEFGADGKMLNGIVEKADGIYYYKNGKISGDNAGLTKVDDDYYFVGSNGKCATSKTYAWATNCDLKCDTYEFGADGKMLNGIIEKDNGNYYYSNGKIGTAGLTKVGEDYYFVGSDGKCATGSKYAWATNCDLKCDTYIFGDDGKMLNGFIEKADGIYYYVNGKNAPVGINYVDGYYYFVTTSGKIITNQSYYAWETNGLLIEDTYTFNELGQITG